MDEIQQKIEEFKQSLTSQSRLKEILLNCPAVLPAIGLLCGLILQFYFNLPLWVSLSILGISIILYLPFNRFLDPPRRVNFVPINRDSARNDIRILFSVFLCFVCLGSIRLINFNKPAQNDIRAIAGSDFTFTHIKAQIITEPRIVENNDWHFAKYYPSLSYTTFYAKVLDIKTESGWMSATGTIKFYISEKVNTLHLGDKFETFCGLNNFSAAENPGQFDTAAYMNRNGVYLSASVKSANALTVFETEKLKSFFDIKAKLQLLAISWLTDDNDDDNTRLAEALILGSRTKIDRKLYDAFIKTGLVHLVCLSGLNVGIFAGVAWWLSKKAGLLHKGRSIACIIATIIFLLVVPPQSSIFRAAIMFSTFCLGNLISRRSFALNSLAVSAILLLLIKPMDFLEPGFQLSFMAVLGLLLFTKPINNFINPPVFFSFLKIPLNMLSVGLAAWIAVIPIIALNFYQLQLLTAIWTVPAAIPATIMIVVGTFKILLTPLLSTLAGILGIIIDFSALVLSYLVKFFAKVPLSYLIIGKPPIYIILLFYLVLFLWYFYPLRKKLFNYLYPCSIVLLIFPAIYIKNIEKFNNLRMTVLSVGHGQAAIIELPKNKNIIIDAGSMTNANIGEKIINPFLDYAAIKNIDSVFISHNDIDHFNGLPEILNKHKYENIYTTPYLIDSNSKTESELKNLYHFKPAPEKIISGKTMIIRLWPDKKSSENFTADNESSLVLLINYRSRKILFCSDITANVQKQIMNLYPDMDVDVIITPHHGSGRTTDGEFINHFKPEYLITSCSETMLTSVSSQIKNHPQSFYTCKDGAITVLIDSVGRIKVKTFVTF